MERTVTSHRDRILDMLGIEEKHECLLNSLPLYRKLALALIPPLQNSLDFLQTSFDALDDANGPRKETPKESQRNGITGEEIDVARPLAEENVLNSFLGMLTTASVYAGVDSIKLVKNLFKERKGKDDEFKPNIINYSYYESDSEASESDEEQRNSLSATLTKLRLKQELRRTETRASTLGLGSEEPKLSTPKSRPTLPKDLHIPPERERSILQNSVMKNLNLTPIKDNVLIRYNVNDSKQDTQFEENKDILKWATAEKLQDLFALTDDDYYYGRYSAWLIKDVVLQGHIHVTKNALCFYSLLPGELTDTELSDPDLTIMEGALGHKTGHYGQSYFLSVYTHRFWGVLKPQTLSIYTSPTEQYFPVKVIDLNDALHCEIVTSMPQPQTPPNDLNSPLARLTSHASETLLSQMGSETSSLAEEDLNNEDVLTGVWIKITCTNKTYRFHTGNIYSARHWYNSITKVIFQLHNSNSQREVMFKIPMRDMIDFKKNYVLAGEDDSDFDNESPVSFTFKFTPPRTNSKFDRLKRKTKNTILKNIPSDFVHVLFFIGGVDFENLMNLILNETSTGDESLLFNTRMKMKARKVVDSDMSSISGQTNPYISTLQPEFTSVSVADKIAMANEHLKALREFDRHRFNGEDDEMILSDLSPENKKTMSKLFGIMKSKANGSLSPRDSADLWDGKLPGGFETWQDGGTLQFPKPFSVLTLKRLRILLITQRRSFDEIARRFEEMSLIKLKHASDMREDSFGSLDSINDERSRDLEPSDNSTVTILSEPKAKKSKMKSLKKSMKTVSTMGGIWSTDPEHHEKFGDDDQFYVEDEHDREVAFRHYQKHFSLGLDAELVASYYAHLRRSLPVYGKLYLGSDRLCFRSMLPGVSTKMILPLKEIEKCDKEKGRKINYSGLHIRAQGGDDLILEFATKKTRDDAHGMIWMRMDKVGNEKVKGRREIRVSVSYADVHNEHLGVSQKLCEDSTELAISRVRAARLRLLEDRVGAASGIEFPLILEDNPFETTEVKPATSYNFTLLTIGSRGDVQPYIALGKGLIAEGHNVTIATHSEFKEWIEKHGINFKEVAGNPAELMSLMVTHGSMSVSFLKEANAKFKGWINELLTTSWKACQGTDILIESPSAMGGIHIAEALGIPYMRAFTMPWTRTKAYPHAFIVPDSKKGGSYNFLTHVMFENLFWKGISGQVNRWRVETLGLPRTNLVKLQQYRIPFLYNVLPAIFPPSVDFPDWVRVTGYWFLDEGTQDYEPPSALVEFLEAAKKNSEKVVYIGFGSIVVGDAKGLTKAVVDAVVELDVKCILNKGWSDRLCKSKDDMEIELPPQIYDAGTIPHDWLFSRIDAAVHHGGSGTTGATLRAGLPTIIKPFFGDQFFYASRVEELGVGMSLKNLNAKSLTKALKSITQEEKYIHKAHAISQAMKHENGVLTAIAAIYSELAYAKLIILTIKTNAEQRKNYEDKSGIQTPNIEEESIFVGLSTQEKKSEDSLKDSEDSNFESETYSSEPEEGDETVLANEENTENERRNCEQMVPSLASALMQLMMGISGHKTQ